jgi:hypothetical protein
MSSSRLVSSYRFLAALLGTVAGLTAAVFGVGLENRLLLAGGLLLTAAGIAFGAYAEFRRGRMHRW